jgi:hypothetical protein
MASVSDGREVFRIDVMALENLVEQSKLIESEIQLERLRVGCPSDVGKLREFAAELPDAASS